MTKKVPESSEYDQIQDLDMENQRFSREVRSPVGPERPGFRAYSLQRSHT